MTAQVGKRVFPDFAPNVDPDDPDKKPPVYPLVVFHLLAATDTTYTRAKRAMVRARFSVRVIGEGSYSTIQVAADRLDALLTIPAAISQTVGSRTYTIMSCKRKAPLMYSESDEGKRYCNLGGIYLIELRGDN